jgi:hypothetical protein
MSRLTELEAIGRQIGGVTNNTLVEPLINNSNAYEFTWTNTEGTKIGEMVIELVSDRLCFINLYLDESVQQTGFMTRVAKYMTPWARGNGAIFYYAMAPNAGAIASALTSMGFEYQGILWIADISSPDNSVETYGNANA